MIHSFTTAIWTSLPGAGSGKFRERPHLNLLCPGTWHPCPWKEHECFFEDVRTAPDTETSQMGWWIYCSSAAVQVILLILSSRTGLTEKVYCVPCTAQDLINQDFFQGGCSFLEERLHFSIFSSSEPSLHLEPGKYGPRGQWNMLVPLCAPIVIPRFPPSPLWRLSPIPIQLPFPSQEVTLC